MLRNGVFILASPCKVLQTVAKCASGAHYRRSARLFLDQPDPGRHVGIPIGRHVDMPIIRLPGIPTCRYGFAMATPIIALASTKGGVGKTTLAFCLATTIARRLSGVSNGRYAGIPEYRPVGMSVFCIDADPNQTLFQTIRRGKPLGVEADVATSDTLLEAIAAASKRARLVLIDLEGSSNQAMLYACGKASLVLIPAQPSMFDVVEAMKTAAVVARASDLTGRPIDCRVVLTRTPVLRQRVAEHSRRQFEQRGLPLLAAELVERAAFRMMTYTGKSPFEEDSEGGAAQNVEVLADEVSKVLRIEA